MTPSAVYRSLSGVPPDERPVHLAIGIFDGVHLGHQAVIGAAVQSAARDGGVCGVLTFFPHPSRLLAPEHATELLLPPEVKRWRLLRRMRVGFVVEEPFNAAFAAMSAAEFVAHLMRHMPRLAAIYVGANWRFGRGKEGNVALLRELCGKHGVLVFSAPPVSLGGDPISSTRIRGLVAGGEIEAANTLLGYEYTSLGAVVEGRRLGRSIGFPTLNISWDPECRPAFGVYAVRVSSMDGDERAPAVANYGLRPTVERRESPLLEVHLLGACAHGPGDPLRVEWRRFQRPERKFATVNALQTQIEADRATAAAWFGSGA